MKKKIVTILMEIPGFGVQPIGFTVPAETTKLELVGRLLKTAVT